MMKTRPTVVDLFSGVGGLSLGFEQAGFDVVAAVEIDPIHAAAHKYNFPECTVIPKSISDVSGDEIKEAASGRPIDVIVGGAPCQGFSLIGQRALDDPRNSLVKDYIRLVSELRPRFFVFENVKGLTVGKHKKFLQEIVDDLTESGYSITLPWKVLNAKDYGVPQSRERLFLMGSLDPETVPTYPAPNNSLVTCKEAIGDLPDIDSFSELLESDKVRFDLYCEGSIYSREMRCTNSSAWHYSYKRKWNREYLTASLRTSHSLISRNRFASTEPGQVEPISRFFKLSEDGVSNTLRAGTDSARGAFTSPRPIHYRHARCVTVREMARLHGFPDWFRFHATKWHGARQIGNAVPPPLVRSIAAEILNVMEIKPTRPRRVIALWDESLLRMNMSQASRYWGVENPISRRDKKSGTKKRKQSEIEKEIKAKGVGGV
jgi:DNA (cytosine-5)-methyltransferase 1